MKKAYRANIQNLSHLYKSCINIDKLQPAVPLDILSHHLVDPHVPLSQWAVRAASWQEGLVIDS